MTRPSVPTGICAFLIILIPSIARTQDSILVPGNPPLKQETVDRFTNFMGWMLEVPFTREQRQMVQDNLVASWKRADKEEMGAVAELLGVQDQLAPVDAGRREIVRAKIAEAYLAEARKQTADPLTRMFMTAYDASHKPIAAGTPPLTRQATDAYFEMLCFMAGEASTGKPYSPTVEEKSKFASQLVERYPKIGKAEKEQMARIPLMWAAMRWAWNDATDDQRKAVRQTWAQALTSMVQAPQSPTAPPPPAAKPQSDKEPDTVTILSKMTPEQASAEMMKRLQNRSLAASTLSNIMTMKYESSMNIIHNMNSGIRYEYRYR